MVEIRMQRIARTCFSSSSFGRFSLRSRAVATMRRRAVEQRRDTRNDCSCDSIPFNMRASSHRCDTIRRYASVSADSSPTSSAPVPAPAPIPSSNYAFLHHVGILVSNLESTIHFYCEILGFKVNDDRPDDKLPYRGVWLDIGCTKDAGAGEKSAQDKQMIHIMELPNPDPMEGRPAHGGRDRHLCMLVNDISVIEDRLTHFQVEFTKSSSGRKALFFRDPDMNCLELTEIS